MLRRNISFLIVFCISGFALNSNANANEMEIFLKSCAYGTAAGALLGLASLAISEDPSGDRDNIARGASLGLYAGIGFGLYTINTASMRNRPYESEVNIIQPPKPPVQQMWFSLITRNRQVEGAQLNWAHFSF